MKSICNNSESLSCKGNVLIDISVDVYYTKFVLSEDDLLKYDLSYVGFS